MLHDQELPLFMWTEACRTVVYLQNRSPHKAIGSRTPKEAFTGVRPDVEHFRMFGCLAFSHVPSEKMTNLEPTAEKGIFVGYSETSKAYRIYIPVQRKLVVRRDVKFEEDRAFRKSMELRDRDSSQVPQVDQITAQGDSLQVTGGPSTGTTVSPGSSVTQVIGTGAPGTGMVQVSGAGTQVTGTGTPGDSGTGAGSLRTGTGLQDPGVGHSSGPSLVREPVQTEEHEDSVHQEVT